MIVTQVTHESNHILLFCDSAMLQALNFCFYLFYCNLKEKYIRRIYYFDLPKIRVIYAHATKNKLPSPKDQFFILRSSNLKIFLWFLFKYFFEVNSVT